MTGFMLEKPLDQNYFVSVYHAVHRCVSRHSGRRHLLL